MQEEGGSQRARFARHIAMQAAVAPEPALPDDFVDDVGNNETPKRSLVKQAHQFARVTAFGIRHEYRHDAGVVVKPNASPSPRGRAMMRRAEPMSAKSADPSGKRARTMSPSSD